MTVERSGLVIRAGEGKDISLAQHRQRTIRVKAGEQETAGAYQLFESTVPAGGRGAPPHLHRRAEEGFYVLEGALNLRLGEEEIEATAGTFVLVPRGLAHSFDNHGAVPARYLVIWSPAEAGRYFAELAELERSQGREPDAETVAALRRRYEFVYL